jgi:hypothetical protein
MIGYIRVVCYLWVLGSWRFDLASQVHAIRCRQSVCLHIACGRVDQATLVGRPSW